MPGAVMVQDVKLSVGRQVVLDYEKSRRRGMAKIIHEAVYSEAAAGRRRTTAERLRAPSGVVGRMSAFLTKRVGIAARPLPQAGSRRSTAAADRADASSKH